jgi:predicted dehydrogenase/nucleoside-diphosphate-sugar epimerase
MSDAGSDQIHIALVGCGEAARQHAKAISSVPGLCCVAVCDAQVARAEAFSRAYFPAAHASTNVEDIARRADAVIVAPPNNLHAPFTLKLLNAGLHVLCENPLATKLSDAREMLATASAAGRVLQCGFMRRFFGSTDLVSEVLRRKIAGPARRFEIRESVGNWPLSRAYFDPESAGGGVLIDLGPDVFNLLSSWFGPVEICDYRDDFAGRMEATAWLKVRCRSEDIDVQGDIFLTRAYKIQSYARIYCDNGSIEISGRDPNQIKISLGHGTQQFLTTAKAAAQDPLVIRLKCFVDAIRGKDTSLESVKAAVADIALIESCYENRSTNSGACAIGSTTVTVEQEAQPYRKILLTGATGMIGSRLVEMWAARGRLGELRCMVRSYNNAARLMRFPVDVVEADLIDAESVKRAAVGCDAIVHLGVGEGAERETKALLKAARQSGIRRFIHISSAAVYGLQIPRKIEEAQEQSELVHTGQAYPDAKAAAEKAVARECTRGLEGVILRPSIVYGPYMQWSGILMTLLAEGRIRIFDDGGWCNLIYIDDLIEAVGCALKIQKGFGIPMFITDGSPITWRDYIEAHAALINVRPVRCTRGQVIRSPSGVREWLRASIRPVWPILRSREFRAFLHESPVVKATALRGYLALRNQTMFRRYATRFRRQAARVDEHSGDFDRDWTNMQLSEARLRPTLAEAVLGFRARVDFAEGMRRTIPWFQHYGLAPPDDLYERDC